jgi:hypothetical protein
MVYKYNFFIKLKKNRDAKVAHRFEIGYNESRWISRGEWKRGFYKTTPRALELKRWGL